MELYSLDILICPETGGILSLSPERNGLVAENGRFFPFRDPGFVDLRPSAPVNAATKHRETAGWQTVAQRHNWRVNAEQILSLPESGTDGFWSRAAAEFRIANRILGDVSGKKGLDLACGVGWAAARFASLGAKMVAADFNDSEYNGVAAAAQLRGVGELSIDFVCCDSEQLPLRSESMDFAFISSALHHFTRPAVSLREVARILRPSGKVVCISEAMRPAGFRERRSLDENPHYREFVAAGINEQMFSQREYEQFFRTAGLGLTTLLPHWDEGDAGAAPKSWVGGGASKLARSHPNPLARTLLRLGGASLFRWRKLYATAQDRVFVGEKPRK